MSDVKWLPPTEPDAVRRIVERVENLCNEFESGEIMHDDYRALRAAIVKDAEWLDAHRTQWPQGDVAAEQLGNALRNEMMRHSVWDVDTMAAAVLAALALDAARTQATPITQWPSGPQAAERLGDAWADVRLQELVMEYGEGIQARVNISEHRRVNRVTAAAVLAALAAQDAGAQGSEGVGDA